MSKIKFGIFGGTFAPVHLGHIHAAREFLRFCQLDELHIIPTYKAPHKEMPQELDTPTRLALLRLAVAECLPDGRVVVDDYEIQKGDCSYTCETLSHFASPERELWFLCGTDMFLTLDAWKDPQTIFSLAKIAFLYRSERDADYQQLLDKKADLYREKYGATVVQIPTDAIEVSSTDLRADFSMMASSVYLPRSVKQYLKGLTKEDAT